MKKWIVILSFVVFCLGLMGCNENSDQLATTAIDSAAMLAGSFLAKEHPEIVDNALAFQEQLEANDIDPALINHGLKWLADYDVNPLIIRQILILARDMGATVDFEDGKILGMIDVNDKYIAVAIEGFFEGIRLTAYSDGGSQ
jgi:uncharacterized lipoprotein NlpE involved in copper resistance